MDKRRLNNEIVLCRPAIRKAKVAVIRKLLKKINILKTCKAEVLKEKKLKKSKRLFEKIQIMKRVKDDEVTKFALETKDPEDFLRIPKINLRENALACLAKHEAVMKKIKLIREQIPNWEVELPILLDSLGKRKKIIKKVDIHKADVKKPKPNGTLSGKIEVIQTKKIINNSEHNLTKNTSEKRKIKLTESIPRKHEIYSNNNGQYKEADKTNGSSENVICEKAATVEKIDDPFFIEKKVIAPKKSLIESLIRMNMYDLAKSGSPVLKKISNSEFLKESFKSKNFNPESKKEDLHPSWAAKKVKLIKPFQGTKIKFSDN